MNYGHHVACNYHSRPIGGPGCICIVHTKKDSADMQTELEILREIAGPKLEGMPRTIIQVQVRQWSDGRLDYEYVAHCQLLQMIQLKLPPDFFSWWLAITNEMERRKNEQPKN